MKSLSTLGAPPPGNGHALLKILFHAYHIAWISYFLLR